MNFSKIRDFLLSVLLGLIFLAPMFVLHEAGHFWAGRSCGVTPIGYALGYGPTLAEVRIDNVDYALRAFPIGASTSFANLSKDVDFFDPRHQKALDEIAAKDSRYGPIFRNPTSAINLAPPQKRLWVSVAGPLAHLLYMAICCALAAHWITKGRGGRHSIRQKLCMAAEIQFDLLWSISANWWMILIGRRKTTDVIRSILKEYNVADEEFQRKSWNAILIGGAAWFFALMNLLPVGMFDGAACLTSAYELIFVSPPNALDSIVHNWTSNGAAIAVVALGFRNAGR